MSKMSELSQVLDELISCGEKMIETANAIKKIFSADAPATEPISEDKPKKAPAYSKEDVRALLARRANESGGQFKAQVKSIVKKYGNGGSLTDVPTDSYPALVKEVEGLTDA
ncbi:hypothetical protein GCM10008910_20600 [Faecalicatena orotica]|uniref:rRNA biogenesis protein rrp5 n=1 Tax=Faecalicatena orotica TaxID=1544 RepID=A0A2Y9C4B4_9FIRM|nr:hypothetical protein [Faecalicatena orotica]PWJ32288.1 hypothetical protein A8806_101576 [Faecalicatena orotica]SSA54122.1 hypothetical protein SAMN05216536_101576 [Faecalicatena orotica]